MSEKTEEKQDTSKGKVCTGDCLACSVPQRIYCSAQVGRDSFVLLKALSENVTELSTVVKDLSKEVSDLKKDAELLTPVVSEK